jgi:hypothetical protein
MRRIPSGDKNDTKEYREKGRKSIKSSGWKRGSRRALLISKLTHTEVSTGKRDQKPAKSGEKKLIFSLFLLMTCLTI